MAKLKFTDEPFAGREFVFVLEKTTVGRAPGHHLSIHHDSVSHDHCEIHVNGTEVIVRDLGSKNGTFVDGVRLKDSQAQLKHGQIVRFGSVKARLELGEEDEDADTTFTAVGLLDKYAQASEKKRAAEADPVMMELGTGGDEADQTVLLKSPKADIPKTNIPEFEPSEIPGRRHGGKIIAIVIIIVLVGLVLLLALKR